MQILFIKNSVFPQLNFIVSQISSAAGSVSGWSVLSHNLYIFLGVDDGTSFHYRVCLPLLLPAPLLLFFIAFLPLLV